MLDTPQLKHAKSDKLHLPFSTTDPKNYYKFHEFFI